LWFDAKRSVLDTLNVMPRTCPQSHDSAGALVTTISFLSDRGALAHTFRTAVLSATAVILVACNGGSASSEASGSISNSTATDKLPVATAPPQSNISGSSQTSTPAEAPPTLSGSPPTTAVVGIPYGFQPSSDDPAGRTLSFSIKNKPPWAAFNTSTGYLFGTPIAGDGGTNANILISASDGAASTNLPAFSIHVTQAVLAVPRSATAAPSTASGLTVTWVQPTLNTDGSVITNLTGYRIHYGTTPTELTNTVDVDGTNILSYVLTDLAPGIWYYAVTAVNSESTESDLSSIGSSTI
jgi:hypothetical protein